MELELERSQHHLRQSVFAQWNLGLWNSEPGTHIQSHLQRDRIVSLFLRPALLLRNDRHGHGGESIAYTNADTHAHIYTDTSSISYPDRNAYANIYTHTYAHIYTHTSSISYPDRNAYADSRGHTYPYSHTNRYTHANSHGHTYADTNSHPYAHSHTDTNGYPYAHSHTDTNGHPYAHSHADTNGHTDAVHRKMFTNAEAGSDSGAASHATASDSWHVHSRSYAEPRARGNYSCRG
jgi:hypothetical protein